MSGKLEHARTLHPSLLKFCGYLAIFGAIALVVGNIWGSLVVPDHDWVADTVSDLAAGEYEIIQDFALYLYAAGLLGLALAGAHFHAGKRWWSAGILSLAILAALVVVIGARNEYGDGDNEGVVIHIYLVYGLGVFFLIAPLSLARGLAKRSTRDAMISRGCAIAWGIAAPIFFFLPTEFDGLWERGLGVITVIWVIMMGLHFLRAAQDLAES
ncbi:DUF998 domain-containing protein [Litoreibacter roseus]|uniref:DUF998 domain-containing protein n=1 Tax=Litoreibacter roseus TaxID=2601869 RepID=A0A6N6JE28_9RHOB|nr:DUF998 domain-containing protein [Litoreibacter roseus]GFE63538.1 hypothetical protein KIN_06120 [Litoreibacter roseus]